MPLIAAVNRPVTVHSEYALLADIMVAATMVFADFPHLTFGFAPDGIQVAREEDFIATALSQRSHDHTEPGAGCRSKCDVFEFAIPPATFKCASVSVAVYNHATPVPPAPPLP